MKILINITFVTLSAVWLSACGGGGSGGDESGAAVASETEVSATPKVSVDEQIVLSGCSVDKYQAELIELVNAARSEARMCGSESFAAVPPVTYSCTLEGAAKAHSVDMATNNFFSHTGSDGLTVGHRVTATGYKWSVVGENIAAGYASPVAVTAAWLDSPGHCRNVMDPRFTEFAAFRADSQSADYSNYWTQVYGAPK